jgi:thymidylate kinase
MKNLLILFEGQDRVGKDTQITLVKKLMYPERMFQVLHYSKVPFDTNKENMVYSLKLYYDMFRLFYKNEYNFIANRSHIGEMVYGPLFRHYDGTYVLEVEKRFKDNPKWDNVVLVTLINDPEILIKREDGSSLSGGKLNIMKKEHDLFKEAHEASLIKNKILIECKEDSPEKIHGTIANFLSVLIS